MALIHLTSYPCDMYMSTDPEQRAQKLYRGLRMFLKIILRRTSTRCSGTGRKKKSSRSASRLPNSHASFSTKRR
jgi:hypothetical protein